MCKLVQEWTEILDPDDEICLSSYQAICIGTMKNHLRDRTYASLCHLSKLYCDRVKPSQPSSFSQQLLLCSLAVFTSGASFDLIALP